MNDNDEEIKSVCLEDFVRGGTSRFVCVFTHGDCPRGNILSVDGRECASFQPCHWKRKRYTPQYDAQFFGVGQKKSKV